MVNPVHPFFENLGNASDSMGECESFLGGLDNLGKLSVAYSEYHHLIKLIEVKSILDRTYSSDYSSGEAKAFTDGAMSILKGLEACFLEVEKKKAPKDEDAIAPDVEG